MGEPALVVGLVGGTYFEQAPAVGQLRLGEDVRADAEVAALGGFLVGDAWYA